MPYGCPGQKAWTEAERDFKIIATKSRATIAKRVAKYVRMSKGKIKDSERGVEASAKKAEAPLKKVMESARACCDDPR